MTKKQEQRPDGLTMWRSRALLQKANGLIHDCTSSVMHGWLPDLVFTYILFSNFQITSQYAKTYKCIYSTRWVRNPQGLLIWSENLFFFKSLAFCCKVLDTFNVSGFFKTINQLNKRKKNHSLVEQLTSQVGTDAITCNKGLRLHCRGSHVKKGCKPLL